MTGGSERLREVIADVLHVSADDLGALLVGIGAVLIFIDATAGPNQSRRTIGGTLPEPRGRFADGAQFSGAVMAAVGSALLLFASTGLEPLIVVLAIAVSLALTYIVATVRLHEHAALLATYDDDQPTSWMWCATHPLWRP
jgi:hypothetical protein